MKLSDDDRRAIATASIAFGATSSVSYVALRVIECVRSGPINLTLVVYSIHTAFYWRLATALFWGGISAVVAFAWARRSDHVGVSRFMRLVDLSIVPLALVLAVLAWRWP